MRLLRTIGREAFGLFVEDWRLSAVLVPWMALAAALGRWLWPAGSGGALLLFAGCALVLVENVVRTARRDR